MLLWSSPPCGEATGEYVLRQQFIDVHNLFPSAAYHVCLKTRSRGNGPLNSMMETPKRRALFHRYLDFRKNLRLVSKGSFRKQDKLSRVHLSLSGSL